MQDSGSDVEETTRRGSGSHSRHVEFDRTVRYLDTSSHGRCIVAKPQSVAVEIWKYADIARPGLWKHEPVTVAGRLLQSEYVT